MLSPRPYIKSSALWEHFSFFLSYPVGVRLTENNFQIQNMKNIGFAAPNFPFKNFRFSYRYQCTTNYLHSTVVRGTTRAIYSPYYNLIQSTLFLSFFAVLINGISISPYGLLRAPTGSYGLLICAYASFNATLTVKEQGCTAKADSPFARSFLRM